MLQRIRPLQGLTRKKYSKLALSSSQQCLYLSHHWIFHQYVRNRQSNSSVWTHPVPTSPPKTLAHWMKSSQRHNTSSIPPLSIDENTTVLDTLEAKESLIKSLLHTLRDHGKLETLPDGFPYDPKSVLHSLNTIPPSSLSSIPVNDWTLLLRYLRFFGDDADCKLEYRNFITSSMDIIFPLVLIKDIQLDSLSLLSLYAQASWKCENIKTHHQQQFIEWINNLNLNASFSNHQFSAEGIAMVWESLAVFGCDWHSLDETLRKNLLEALYRHQETLTSEPFITTLGSLRKLRATKNDLGNDFFEFVEKGIQKIQQSNEAISDKDITRLTARVLLLQYSLNGLSPSSRCWLQQRTTTVDLPDGEKSLKTRLYFALVDSFKNIPVPVEVKKHYEQLVFSLLTELQSMIKERDSGSIGNTTMSNINASVYMAILGYFKTVGYKKSMFTEEQVSLIINSYLQLYSTFNPEDVISGISLLSHFGLIWSDIPKKSRVKLTKHYIQTLPSLDLSLAGNLLRALLDIGFFQWDNTEVLLFYEAIERWIAKELHEEIKPYYLIMKFLNAVDFSKIPEILPIPASTKQSITALLSRYHDQFSGERTIKILAHLNGFGFDWLSLDENLRKNLLQAIYRDQEALTSELFLKTLGRLGKMGATKYSLPLSDFLAFVDKGIQKMQRSNETIFNSHIKGLTKGLELMQITDNDLSPSCRSWLAERQNK